jgi:hypothetical protein
MTRDPAQSSAPSHVRFIKPANILKQKVGTGGIDEALLEKSQKFIETAELDFLPYANQFLEDLVSRIKKAKTGKDTFQEKRDSLIRPVMQLKANGGMFQFQLVSDVADIALQFLEEVQEMNEDVFEVLSAHVGTIQVILTNNLRGDGGSEGYALVKELDKACKRYFAKYKKAE